MPWYRSGNVTISYAYSGQYIQNATLLVFPHGTTTNAVFRGGRLRPGTRAACRGGASTWTAVTPGAYDILLDLGTPYGGHEHLRGGQRLHPERHRLPEPERQFGRSSVGCRRRSSGTVMAIIAAIVGRSGRPVPRSSDPRRPHARPRRAPPRTVEPVAPWQEDAKPGGKLTCSICHEEFETEFAIHQHQKIAHGMEE